MKFLDQPPRFLFFTGKGGVGKTTLAAAIAVDLAHRGFPVHLTTSDPAAHLTGTLEGSIENLTISRIDPCPCARCIVSRRNAIEDRSP